MKSRDSSSLLAFMVHSFILLFDFMNQKLVLGYESSL